jgi:hypothetical protein
LDERKRQLYSDLLELAIVLALLFMVITIYVPRAIWDEEEKYQNLSRFNMENVFNVETFYRELTDQYDENGLWALSVVNAVRDSLTADSTYLGERTLTLLEHPITVNISKGYDVEFDTTFGFLKSRRDTIFDTTVTVVLYSPTLSRNDTTYIPKKNLATIRADSNFIAVLQEEPTFRVETVSYYDSYMPDSSMFFCPLTKQPYIITISEDQSSLKVASPITQLYIEGRYLLFSFRAENHGFINDGVRSWEQ